MEGAVYHNILFDLGFAMSLLGSMGVLLSFGGRQPNEREISSPDPRVLGWSIVILAGGLACFRLA